MSRAGYKPAAAILPEWRNREEFLCLRYRQNRNATRAAAATPRGTPRPIPTLALELKPWGCDGVWVETVGAVEEVAAREEEDELLGVEVVVVDAVVDCSVAIVEVEIEDEDVVVLELMLEEVLEDEEELPMLGSYWRALRKARSYLDVAELLEPLADGQADRSGFKEILALDSKSSAWVVSGPMGSHGLYTDLRPQNDLRCAKIIPVQQGSYDIVSQAYYGKILTVA